MIVEDREMLQDNGQGGRLPPGGQPMDPSARARLSEREGPFQPRTFLPYPPSFIGIFPSFQLFISSVVLSDQQQMPLPVMPNMTSIRREPLPNHNFRVANLSICPHNKALATSWVEDSLPAHSACLVWLERCQTINLRHLRRCRIMINNDL